jgi:diguanylate cyclase (GGDEF)-like protein
MAENESRSPGAGTKSNNLSDNLQNAAIPAEARDAIMRLLEEIKLLRSEIEANNQRIAELEDLADRDPLTPVVNRRAFVRELDRAKAYGDRYGNGASLIYLDLDGMKEINDRYGHNMGDKALVAIAESLVANVRSSDLVGRLGGDEFGVILARADQSAAQEKARLLMKFIGDIEIKSGNEIIPVSVSYGIIELRSQTSAEAALAAADRAMYERKQTKASGEG